MGTHFFWDPVEDNIIAEYDDDGNLIADYTTEPGYHGRLISEHRNAHTYYHHYDADGNTLALTDEEGNVVDTFAYTANGEITERTGTTPTPFQYKGEHGYYRDALTGEYMARARDYDPDQARWLSKDPLTFLEGTNLYQYVRNNPNSFIDPSGLLSQNVIVDIIGFIPIFSSDTSIGDNCAAFAFITLWQPGKSETNGLIIQKVCNKLDPKPKTCDGKEPTPIKLPVPNTLPCNDPCYYEIWRVSNGAVFDGGVFATPPKSTGHYYEEGDWFAHPGYTQCTRGGINKYGEAVFVPDAVWKPVKGDLEKMFGTGPSGVESAGGLFSACPNPTLNKWWNDLAKKPGVSAKTTKRVIRKWNCCKGKVCCPDSLRVYDRWLDGKKLGDVDKTE